MQGQKWQTVTAEERVKHYKNGKSQAFSYYRCTKKRKDKKCNQRYMPISDLDGQFISELTQLELDEKFAQWSLKALDFEIEKGL